MGLVQMLKKKDYFVKSHRKQKTSPGDCPILFKDQREKTSEFVFVVVCLLFILMSSLWFA